MTDVSNIRDKVKEWQIWDEANQKWEGIGNGRTATIAWTNNHYKRYTDIAGYIQLKMITNGGEAGERPEKVIKLNPIRADHGITINVETDGKTSRYEMREGRMNEITVAENSKIWMEGKAIAEYRLWDPNAQKIKYIESGKIFNILDYKENVIKLMEEDRYQARIGITRDGGATEGYDVVINLARDEIALILGGTKYEASEKNPLVEGVYLSSIQLKNKKMKNAVKWEVYNQRNQEYDKHHEGAVVNEIVLNTGAHNYILAGIHKYCIKVRVTFEDGTQEIKEIYQEMVKIETPYNNQVIKSYEDLEISWNGKEDREYFIRMVELSDKGDEYNVAIVEGDIVKGSTYTIDSSKLKENTRYRMALRGANGKFYDIITISTAEISDAIITNIDEIRTIKAGEEIKIEMAGKKEGEKYLIGIYEAGGQLIKIVETTNDEAIIMKEGESEAGRYEIGVNILREGMSTKGTKYTITIK